MTAMRATPPSLRMSDGTRSSAMTAQAPAFSAILACSALVTSMMTPPLSISARPTFTRQAFSPAMPALPLPFTFFAAAWSFACPLPFTFFPFDFFASIFGSPLNFKLTQIRSRLRILLVRCPMTTNLPVPLASTSPAAIAYFTYEKQVAPALRSVSKRFDDDLLTPHRSGFEILDRQLRRHRANARGTGRLCPSLRPGAVAMIPP